MNILSYRGPSTAGGVSSALAGIIETVSDGDPRWWYIHDSAVETRTSVYAVPETIKKLPEKLINGHYAYCNNFIWPILHDLPQHALFSMRDRRLYQQFNKRFARSIIGSRKLTSRRCFVNDYQLALATGLLSKASAIDIILFWHVPWPQAVSSEHAPYLAEIATGLLGARRIGFHTEEYAENFLNFVDKYVPTHRADFVSRRIISAHGGSVTELMALPLGLDYRFWRDTAAACTPLHKDMDMRAQIPGQFILSVDRADYTKGVLERMEAIDHYFAAHPDRIGKIAFVQVCQPTRVGLPGFDDYWQKCRARSKALNTRWQSGAWQPVVWIDKPVPAKVLAWLYNKAEAMLINPVRDGLNLTAKEFAVCSNNGALILSRGAGVWHELGDKVLPIERLTPAEIAAQIETSLTMPLEDKLLRLREMKKIIAANNLKTWWRNFEKSSAADTNVVPISSRAQKTGTNLLMAK